MVVGAPGVGKTHLVRAVLDELQAKGLPVLRLAATASTATIPFGAVADLLPTDHAVSPERVGPGQAWLLRGVAAAVRRRGGRRPVVVGVDDAHLLDAGSAAAVLNFVMTGTARVIATVQEGESCPDAVVALWKDHGVDRLELDELGPEDARKVAAELLGSRPPSAKLWVRLWRGARGNPLYLSDLVRGGLQTRAIRVVDGVGELVGSLAPSGRLTELLASRLERCSPKARAVLQMLALAEPLSLAVIEAAVGDAVVGELEQAGLAEAGRTAARVEARTRHPAIAETVRAMMPESVRHDRARSLVAALEARPLRRRQDRLHACLLRLEAGSFDEPDRFVDAAAEALDSFDAALAERLLTPALDTADPVEARVLLGRSLRLQHRADDAGTHLVVAAGAAADDRQRAQAALELAQARMYEQHRPADAMATLQQAHQAVADVAWRHELDAMAALFTTFTGDLRAAAALGDRVLEQPAPTRSALTTLAVSTISQVLLGRLPEAEDALRVALPLTVHAPPDASLAVELLAINEFMCDLFSGRVRDGVHKARAGFARARNDDLADVVGPWGSTLMQALLISGHMAEAASVGADTLAALELSDPLGLLGSAVAVYACVCAQSGDAPEARRLLDHPALTAAAKHEARSRYQHDRAEVWATVAEGRLERAAEHALEGGLRAVDNDLLVWGALLLHDAARVQRPERVMPHLRALADRVGCQFVPALADHAEALTAADGSAVLDVKDAFADMGATLLGAEAAGQASGLLHTAGRDRAARRAGARSRELARDCRGARTPALTLAPEPLTNREREVSLMAVSGLTNREVALDLGVSKRTVDNHLASVYRKLDVAGREELARVLQR